MATPPTVVESTATTPRRGIRASDIRTGTTCLNVRRASEATRSRLERWCALPVFPSMCVRYPADPAPSPLPYHHLGVAYHGAVTVNSPRAGDVGGGADGRFGHFSPEFAPPVGKPSPEPPPPVSAVGFRPQEGTPTPDAPQDAGPAADGACLWCECVCARVRWCASACEAWVRASLCARGPACVRDVPACLCLWDPVGSLRLTCVAVIAFVCLRAPDFVRCVCVCAGRRGQRHHGPLPGLRGHPRVRAVPPGGPPDVQHPPPRHRLHRGAGASQPPLPHLHPHLPGPEG